MPLDGLEKKYREIAFRLGSIRKENLRKGGLAVSSLGASKFRNQRHPQLSFSNSDMAVAQETGTKMEPW